MARLRLDRRIARHFGFAVAQGEGRPAAFQQREADVRRDRAGANCNHGRWLVQGVHCAAAHDLVGDQRGQCVASEETGGIGATVPVGQSCIERWRLNPGEANGEIADPECRAIDGMGIARDMWRGVLRQG